MLDFSEEMPQAVAYLKRTLPVLRKNGLTPHPINYGLWYVHTSGRQPELSALLEKVADGEEPYDDAVAKRLFETYICLKGGEISQKTIAKFHLLTSQLQENLRKSIDSSSDVDRSIQGSLQSLQSAFDIDDVAATVASVIALLDEVNQKNQQYRQSMQQANDEIGNLRSELDRLQSTADTDELTRLANQAAFYRELRQRIERGGDGLKLCVVVCDIDYFKSINDNFGHLMGDRVLQRIGCLLLEQCRNDTLAARYGGEEFAMIVAGADLGAASVLAERLRIGINQLRIKIRDSDKLLESLTASFGIACYRAGDTAEILFDRADRALYLAKDYGRNITLTERSL